MRYFLSLTTETSWHTSSGRPLRKPYTGAILDERPGRLMRDSGKVYGIDNVEDRGSEEKLSGLTLFGPDSSVISPEKNVLLEVMDHPVLSQTSQEKVVIVLVVIVIQSSNVWVRCTC